MVLLDLFSYELDIITGFVFLWVGYMYSELCSCRFSFPWKPVGLCGQQLLSLSTNSQPLQSLEVKNSLLGQVLVH